MTAIWLTPALLPIAILSSGKQAADIFVVLGDDEEGKPRPSALKDGSVHVRQCRPMRIGQNRGKHATAAIDPRETITRDEHD
jgi:hypothetical protein